MHLGRYICKTFPSPPLLTTCTLGESGFILSLPKALARLTFCWWSTRAASEKIDFQKRPEVSIPLSESCQGIEERCLARASLSWGFRACDGRTRCKDPSGSTQSAGSEGSVASDTRGAGNLSSEEIIHV